MSTTVTYKGSTLTTVENATKKLTTAGTWLEDDITIQDVSSGGGGSVVVVDTPDSHGGTIREITAQNTVSLQAQKQVTMTQNPQTFTKTAGYDGFESIIVTDPNMREDLTVPKDVDFIDYDGRLVYSYTAQEFLALTQMPDNPINAGLTAQGWNWTLADAKEYVAEWGALVIGQSYITDDGKTRLYVSITDTFIQYGLSMQVYVYRAETGTAYTIDWGDGSTPSTNSGAAGNSNLTHSYSAYGDYVIEITVTSGSVRLGYQGSNQSVLSSDLKRKILLNKVEIGSGVVGLARDAFDFMPNLKSVSIPTTCINHDSTQDNAIFGGQSLTGIVFPIGTPGQNTRMVGNQSEQCLHLKYIAIPKAMNGFVINSPNMRSLRKLTFNSFTVSTTLGAYLYDCVSLTNYIVPGTYTTITTDRCRNSYIRKLTIPETVTSIAATAFSYNYWCAEVHLLPITPPTLVNVNAFNQIGANLSSPAVFYVPYSADHSILEAYQTATNWSTYASQMQEEPQS